MGKPGDLILDVPYYSQRKSVTNEALRMCFSASCSMCAEYISPGCIKGGYALKEDNYLKNYVHKYGDSTNASAQLQALSSLGIKAKYSQSGTWATINAQLKANKPVPIGILHHGDISSPSGGGHWIVIIGILVDGKTYVVNDPYGELDLINGMYISEDGYHKRYSKENLGKRWMVDGPGSGWCILF